MATNLIGKNVKVYPYTFTDIPGTRGPDKTQVIDIIANNTPFDYFFAIPVINVSAWNNLPSSLNLYDAPTLPTLPSVFNAETAALFDSAINNWQLSSCFVSVSDEYSGTVPVNEAIGLFPNAYDITSYLNNNDFKGFVIYFPDIKFAYVIQRGDNTTSYIIGYNMLYDIEGSNTGVQVQIFPYMEFIDGAVCYARIGGKLDNRHIASFEGGSTSGRTNTVRYAGKSNGNSISEVFIRSLDEDFIPPHTDDEDDPYDPGGTSGPGGGTGTFDSSSDPIDIPSVPTLSAVDTGFITLFNPTLGQLKNLANYMWSDTFSLDNFKKMFANPMDAILGLSIVPVAVPSEVGRQVIVGNIPTGVTMNVATTQYVTVDCGTLNVEEFWGAYLDYDPYTKCSIFLPYIGVHPIKTDDVMGKSVHVVYRVDILSGSCVAFVKCGDSVLYEFIGQLASSIPITGDNFTNVINGVLNIAGSIGTMVATGGFSAPAGMVKKGLATAYQLGNEARMLSSMAQDVMAMKPEIEKSGSLSGTGGMLGNQIPYMILERPRQALPAGFNGFAGYPSHMTAQLGTLSGYTEVEHIHLENVPCTMKEADEILAFLQNGVIL